MQKITSENFETFIDSDEPVLVDFWAEWCGPCRAMNPILDEFNETMPVGKLNVDEVAELAHTYHVQSIPTMIVYQNGEEAMRIVGTKSLDELKTLTGNLDTTS